MSRLSVITLTLNEEHNIEACLESVRWADEIIVIDAGSTDRTLELARKYTSHVEVLPWRGYGAARNSALDRTTGDWILWLDADERVTPELAGEIREVVAAGEGKADGYAIPRRAYFCGKWIRHCGWYPSRVVRLFRRGSARFSETRVHEELVIAGRVADSRHDLLHFTDPDMKHYFAKFNTYTSLAAEDMFGAGRKFHVSDIILKPTFTLFKMYVLRLGFLDGIHGLVLSLASAAYVFAKYAKLWDLSRQSQSEH
jgi:glycosyltransferase involved in cell wall biosynthesis